MRMRAIDAAGKMTSCYVPRQRATLCRISKSASATQARCHTAIPALVGRTCIIMMYSARASGSTSIFGASLPPPASRLIYMRSRGSNAG